MLGKRSLYDQSTQARNTVKSLPSEIDGATFG